MRWYRENVMWITKIRFFDWNCERPHNSCPTGLFTRPWQPYARARRRAAAQADVGRHAAIYRATTDRVCPRPLPGLRQRDVPCVDASTLKDVARSVHWAVDDC